ncbi:MAG: metal-sulfur cluster assembly factor [Ignavibacteriota bacterium]|jgi:metal-sulfur cluster biosynthetic enzyme|nr:metal-sulfur cluster assembly factor [Ignavibacteriales bacterium]MBL1122163.1 metal-sulfur cluster assembly factor [Ignavibacteriota bacterium]MCE7856962.1 metal-sulfur cluster assembly factor [Ignavibacteria bacterium CHB3]MCL4279026.1 metal-sulfur cluster assembly factor [Ignavibacteriaceae bacterium]NUM63332.1 metal-sulfur cluster assembly factor [Ignavibacteriaceae bacterium]
MAQKEEILEILKGVIDPEIGINIVDLGLVYEIESTDETNKITMTLTTPGCPMHNTITTWVENVISQFEPKKKVIVDLVWEPRWTPDKMSKEAKQELYQRNF